MSFLTQLRAVKDGLATEEQSWIGLFPDYSGAPIPARGVYPEILREVYTALIDAKALLITYQSLSRPEPGARVIEPHALAFDGWRWHARAFCRNDAVFKDFLVSRILKVGHISDRQSHPAEDQEWAEAVTLKIGPHPDLSENQKRVFEMDYGMVDGVANITVRRALPYYTLKRLRLDTDPAARWPQDQQIVLLNRDSIMEFGNEPA